MQLDQDFVEAVSDPIMGTWIYFADKCKSEDDNAVAIKLCLTGSNMVKCAGSRDELVEQEDAAKLIKKAIKEHGREEVISFLSKHIELI